MGNSLLSNRDVSSDVEHGIDSYEQKQQQDLALLLSTSSETLNMKKMLDNISTLERISDEMDIPLGEIHSRRKNVDGFWKNIIAGLDEDSTRRRLTLKRLNEQLSVNLKLKSIFFEILEKRLGYIGCGLRRMQNPSQSYRLQLPSHLHLRRHQEIIEKRKLWQLVVDLGEEKFKEIGYDFGNMDDNYIKNNLPDIFQYWDVCEPFLPSKSKKRWRETYSRRLKVLKYNKAKFDIDENKKEDLNEESIKNYTTLDILNSKDDFKTLIWPQLLLSSDCIENICKVYENAFNEGLLSDKEKEKLVKAIVGIVKCARATGSSKFVFTLISCMIKLQHYYKNKSDSNEILGNKKQLQEAILRLLENFKNIKETMNAFPHGIFLNGPLPSRMDLPMIVPPSSSHGQYNMSILCWLDYNNNHSIEDLNGTGEQWYSIKLYRSSISGENAGLKPWIQYTLKFSSKDANIGVVIRNSFENGAAKGVVKEDVVLDRSNDGKVHLGIQMDENGIKLFVNGIKSLSKCSMSILDGWINDSFIENNVHVVMENKTPRYENHVSLLGVFYDVSGAPVRSLLKKMNRLEHFQSHVVTLKGSGNSNNNISDFISNNSINSSKNSKNYNNVNSTFRLKQNVSRPHMKFDMLKKNTADIIEGEVLMYRPARTFRYDIIKSDGYFNSGQHYWEIAVNGNLQNIEIHFGVVSVEEGMNNLTTNYLESQNQKEMKSVVRSYWENVERGNSIIFSNNCEIFNVADGNTNMYKPYEERKKESIKINVTDKEVGTTENIVETGAENVCEDNENTEETDDLQGMEINDTTQGEEEVVLNDNTEGPENQNNDEVNPIQNQGISLDEQLAMALQQQMEVQEAFGTTDVASTTSQVVKTWRDKDRIGILVDFNAGSLTFYLNDKIVCEPIKLKKDSRYVPVFAIGGSKDGSAHCNIIVPPRLNHLPPLDIKISDGKQLKKTGDGKKVIDDSTDKTEGENHPKKSDMEANLLPYTFEVYESKHGISRFYNNTGRTKKNIFIKGTSTLYELRDVISKEFDIGNAMLVQLRFFKDEWKHEVSLTPNSDEGSFTVAQLAQLRGDKLPLHIYIRRGTGISRAKNVTDKDNDTTITSNIGKKVPENISMSWLDMSGRMLKLINSSCQFHKLPNRPYFKERANKCLSIEVSKYTLAQLQDMLHQVFEKLEDARLKKFGENDTTDHENYKCLLEELLKAILSMLIEMKKVGLHYGPASEDINAMCLYKLMMKYEPSDNVSIIDSLSEEDKNDVLNFVPGARLAMQHFSKILPPYSASSWHALFHALSSSDEDFKTEMKSVNHKDKGWHMGSYFPEGFSQFMVERLENVISDDSFSKSIQKCAGEILGEGLLLFYPKSLNRMDIFLQLLMPLDSGESLSLGQESLLSYCLLLFTRRNIGENSNTSMANLENNNLIASAYGCQLLLPTPTINIKRTLIHPEKDGHNMASLVGNSRDNANLSNKSDNDKLIFECERNFPDLSENGLRGKSKDNRILMRSFVDLIRILTKLPYQKMSSLLSTNALNEFDSFQTILQRESGRSLRIPETLISRIIEINGVSVASCTDSEKLSSITKCPSAIQCRILTKTTQVDDDGVADFNNAIGFADWVDVQDTNGKWWIGQIIGEKTEGGVKHLQVKYTANAKPPELIVADTSGIDKNDTSNGENVSENDDETKTGQENSNEQQQEEVHAPNNLVRNSTDEQTYEFWWEMLTYSDDSDEETWIPFSDDIAIIFEEAYCDRVNRIPLDIDDEEHIVDFANMILINAMSGDECEIRRRDEYVATETDSASTLLPSDEWISVKEKRFAVCQSMVKTVHVVEKRGDLRLRFESLLPALQAQLLYQASRFLHLNSPDDAPVMFLLRFCRLVLDECFELMETVDYSSDRNTPSEKLLDNHVFRLLPLLYTSFLAYKRTPWLAGSLLAPSVRLLRALDKVLIKDEDIGKSERNYRDYERATKLSVDMQTISRQTFDRSRSHKDCEFSSDGATCSLRLDAADNQWYTAVLGSSLGPMTKGIHSITFRVDNETPGHLFFGICSPQFIGSAIQHLGAASGEYQTSWGWLESRPRLYPDNARRSYGAPVRENDLVTMTLDLNVGTLSYTVNNTSYGLAYGPGSEYGHPQKLQGPLYFAISLRHTEQVTVVKCSTANSSNFEIPGILQLQKTIGNVCGFFASNLITGPPVSRDEEELKRWLEDPLFASGVESKTIFDDDDNGFDEDPIITNDGINNSNSNKIDRTFVDIGVWADVFARECGGGLSAGGLRRQLSATPYQDETPQAPSVLSPLLKFLNEFSDAKTGIAEKLFQILEKHSFNSLSPIEKKIRKALSKVPHVENIFFAVMLKHSGSDTWSEASNILTAFDSKTDKDSDFKSEPSPRMMKLWDKLIQMRKWLRGVKSAFINIDYASSPSISSKSPLRADDEVKNDDENLNNSTSDETKHEVDDEQKDDDDDHDDSEIIDEDEETEEDDLNKFRPWEHKSWLKKEVPKTFDVLCSQIIKRAKFLLCLKQHIPANSSARRRGKSYNIRGVAGTKDHNESTLSRTGSIQPLLSHYRAPQSSRSNSADDDDSDLIGRTSAVSTCFEYIQDGFNAPPILLNDLINLRKVRANQRIFGLQATLQAVQSTHFVSVKNDVLSWTRQGLRGFSSVEWDLESYQYFHRYGEDEDVMSSSYYRSLIASADARRSPGNSKYSFLKDLSGCNFTLCTAVKNASYALYQETSKLLYQLSTSGHAGNTMLTHTLLYLWCIDYDENDIGFLSNTDIVKTLELFFSSESLKSCQDSYAKTKQIESVDLSNSINENKTEEERILSLVDDAKRLETIEMDFKSIQDDNSALFMASAAELDENILKGLGSNQYDFSNSSQNDNNHIGNKELIKPAHIIFQYIAMASKSQSYSTEERWDIGKVCFDILLDHIEKSLKMVYDEETKEDVNNNDMRPDTILEKYLFKNLASFMSMHDVLPYVDVSSKYRFLKLCLKCLRVASAKIKGLILKILSKVAIYYNMDDFNSASNEMYHVKFMKYMIEFIGQSVSANMFLSLSGEKSDGTQVSQCQRLYEKYILENNNNSFETGYGTGRLLSSVTSGYIMLLRKLLMIEGSTWSVEFNRIIKEHVSSYDEKFFRVLYAENKSASTDSVVLEGSLNYIAEFTALFSIVGGYVESLHVGASCLVKGGSTGTLVDFNTSSSTIDVTFGTSASINPQLVSFSSVVAQDPVKMNLNMLSPCIEDILLHLGRVIGLHSGPSTSFVVCKRIASRCLAYVLSNDKFSTYVGANSEIMKLLVHITRSVLDLPRFMDMEALEFCLTFLNQRYVESSTMRWIDIDQHLEQKSKHQLDREKNIVAARKAEALQLLEFGASVFGWDLELCMHALKVNKDDRERAGRWLQGPQAAAYQRSQIGGSDGDDTERWQIARQLANDFGMPPLLCWHALRLNEDDREGAVNWSFDANGGQRYMAQMISADEMEKSKKSKNVPPNPEAIVFCTNMGFTEDDAVLALNQPAITGAEAAINWLFDTSDEEKARLRAVQLADVIAQTEGEAEASRQNATNELDDKSSLEEIGQAADIMGGSTAEGAGNIGSGNGNNHSDRSHPPAFNFKDKKVYEKGLLVAVSSKNSGISTDDNDMLFGIIKSSTSESVLLCYTSETGLQKTRSFPKRSVRNVTHVFGEQIRSNESFSALLFKIESAVFVQSCRRALLKVMNVLATLDSESSTLIDIAKMVAASENGFAKALKSLEAGNDPMQVIARVLRNRLQDSNEKLALGIADALVKDCTRHVHDTTTLGDSDEFKEFESLHPYYGECNYTETVEYKGAKALRICFDPKCTTRQDTSYLEFLVENGTRAERVAVLHGPAERWKAFVIHTDTFKFRFRSRHNRDDVNTGYGYKFTVSPLLGLQWNRESQVLVDPSLEWACWILDFLTADVGIEGLEVRKAVHTSSVFEALTRYLRSPGAPFKSRVIKILTQLLRNPQLFGKDIPKFTRLKGIKDAVMKRCDEENSNKRLLLSHGLQQLVELAMVARDAAGFFGVEGFLKSVAKDSTTETAMLKKVKDKWKPDTVEIALVYAIRLMKDLEKKVGKSGSQKIYDMAALNDMEVINVDDFKSRKQKRKHAPLILLNQCLDRVMEFVDLSSDDQQSIGSTLNRLRHLIFLKVKTKLMDAALDQSRCRHNVRYRMYLDRYEAAQSRERGMITPHTSKCCFVQAFKQMYHTVEREFLRGADRMFEVGWKGAANEGGIDAGGPYREALNEVASDCSSDNFDLFIRCKNGAFERGLNRDRFVPNPKYTSPLHLQMFEFAGVWMGISYRTRANLPFMLPSIVWKPLVGMKSTLEDLASIDIETSTQIELIVNIKNKEEFETVYPELYFTVNEIELIPGGSNMKVTLENRKKYVRLLEEYHLNLYSQQVKAICRGFGSIVPAQLMRLFTWEEADILTCGSPIIDLVDLKKHTTYSGFTGPEDPTIKIFWKVLEEFSNEQRSRFIEFAWGRSRLPRPGTWNKPLGLTRLGTEPNQLPIAHTCFFNIELPPYDNFEKALKFITIAVEFGTGSMMLG